MEGLLVELGAHGRQQALGAVEQRGVGLDERALGRHLAAAVLGHDRQHALAEIAVGVGEIAVQAADQGALLEVAVVAERHLAQQEVAHRVEPVGRHQLDRIDDVAERLGDLLAFVGPPAMREHALRRREAGRHQEGRPEHAVEADDVLADHVQVGRPVLPQRIAGVGIAARGDVVGERVQPDIHDVLGIARHRHAPREAGARHREVLQAALHEADDLVAPAVRRDEARVLVVEVEQPVGPGRQLEEVGRLLDPLDLGAARRRRGACRRCRPRSRLRRSRPRRAPSTSRHTCRDRCRPTATSFSHSACEAA